MDFSTWRDGVQTCSSDIRVAPEVAFRAHDMVCGAMGSAWLSEQVARGEKPSRGLEDVHPLYRSLTSATQEAVLTVCETAAYLSAFRDDPGITKIINTLRVPDKFDPTLFELAMALRFRLAGASIRLEPLTPHGVADFDARIGGSRFLIEVSSFPLDMLRNEDMAFLFAMQRAQKRGLKRSPRLPFYIATEVHVHEKAAGNVQQEAYTAVSTQVQKYSRIASAGSGPLKQTYSFGTVTVRRAAQRHEELALRGNWAVSSCLTLQRVPDIGTLHGAQQLSQNKRDTHWLHMRVDRSPQQPYRRISQKLKDESRQLRNITDYGIIILSVDGLQQGVFRTDDLQLQHVLAEFARNHSSVSDVWLLTRVWSDGRRVFRGATVRLTGRAVGVPETFADRVVHLDDDLDIISMI